MRLISSALLVCFSMGAASSQEFEPIEGFPEVFSYMVAPDVADVPALQQHIGGSRLWNKGQTLRICFFGGQGPVRELIAQVAAEWQHYSGLIFDFGPAGARRDCATSQTGFSHIRIGFASPGYWSFVGTDSQTIPNQYQPSMNFQHFDLRYSSFNGFTNSNVVANASPSHNSTILHEFGHAQALLHEHQNTNLNCWNHLKQSGPNNVYEYYGTRHNWPPEMVRRNLGLALWSDSDSKSGEIDLKSIMAYMIPEEVLTEGRNSPCYIPQRSAQISDLDKKWIAQAYAHAPAMSIDEFATSEVEYSGLPAGAVSTVQADYLERIAVDLESDDTQVRREARNRLAGFLVESGNAADIKELTNNLSEKPYRYQLGVAVALRSVASEVEINPSALEDLSAALKRAEDPTLVENLRGAVESSQ